MSDSISSPDQAPKVGIPVTTETSLKIEWAKLSGIILQSIEAFFKGNLPGGIGKLLESVKTIHLDRPVGEQIWTVTVLSFAWALSELTSDEDKSRKSLLKLIKELISESRDLVAVGSQSASVEFLYKPYNATIYKELREAAIEQRARFRGVADESIDVLRARLDSAFNRGIFEVFKRNPAIFQSIATFLSNPASSAFQRDLDWEAYRRRLRYDFEVRPVFGQEATKIALSQLYVPLRVIYQTSRNDDLDLNELSPTEIEDKSADADKAVERFDHIFDKWLDHGSHDDFIRLVGGGPGSGKSTSLKSLASRYASRQDWRVIFIPLQYIDLDGDLRDAINRYFTNKTRAEFNHPPLDRASVENGPPLLLIFDGLDEIARPGEAANDVVSLFATKLTNLTSSLRGDSASLLRVIVSGRIPAFQAAKKYLSLTKDCSLEVIGFLPVSPALQAQVADADQGPILEEDQRGAWWSQYARLIGISEQVPEAFQNEELSGLTNEPLLCYLLVLSGFATSNWQMAAENPNRIYRQLVSSIWRRGWGEGSLKRLGPGRTLTLSDFNALMQTIALAAWQGGDTRVASESMFETATSISRTEDAWRNFKQDNGPDVTNLAMNFYLRSSESESRGFEFTHKSFGDYLAARAIVDIAFDLPLLIDRKVDHALTDWVSAVSTGSLSSEVRDFLRDEVRLRLSDGNLIADDLAKLKGSFERFVAAINNYGLPTLVGGCTWREAEVRQREAEGLAWVVLNAICRALSEAGHSSAMMSLESAASDDMQILFHRLFVGSTFSQPAAACFSHLLAPQTSMFDISLDGFDLSYSDVQNSSFAYCSLNSANLIGANLSGCDLTSCDLTGANLSGADLTNADLRGARLERTNFDGATMDGAVIDEASLLYVDLKVFRDKFEGQLRASENPSVFGFPGPLSEKMVVAESFVAGLREKRK